MSKHTKTKKSKDISDIKDIKNILSNLPENIKQHSKEMRKLRMNQKWVSKEEAYKQCRLVELKG